MAAKGAGRGAALRESMRRMLAGKSKEGSAPQQQQHQVQTTVTEGAPMAVKGVASCVDSKQLCASAGASLASEEAADQAGEHSEAKGDILAGLSNEDPFPDLVLAPAAFGVDEGRRRAVLLQRQGDFFNCARVWAKSLYVARRCSPAFSALQLAELKMEYGKALLLNDDWNTAETASTCAISDIAAFKAASSDSPAVSTLASAHCTRARAFLELGRADLASLDIESIRECIGRGILAPDQAEMLEEDVQELENYLRTCQATRPATEPLPAGTSVKPLAPASQEAPQRCRSNDNTAASSSQSRAAQVQSSARPSACVANDISGAESTFKTSAPASQEAAKSGTHRSKIASTSSKSRPAQIPANQTRDAVDDCQDAAYRNQAFFDGMEHEFRDLCSGDGWDEIRRMHEEWNRTPAPARSAADQIPPESDYFRVELPPGSDREVRFKATPGQELPHLRPKRPQRNFDELRRVQNETAKAIEEERAKRQAAASQSSSSSPSAVQKPRKVNLESISDDEGYLESEQAVVPQASISTSGSTSIRTKSDVVHLDSLSDSEDEKIEQGALSEARKQFHEIHYRHQAATEKDKELAK